MIGEGYANCGSVQKYDYAALYPQYYRAGSYYQSASTGARKWNYDPTNSKYTSKSKSNYDYSSVPYFTQSDYSYEGDVQPTFSAYSRYDYTTGTYKTFEVTPKVNNGIGECSNSGMQASTSAGAQVAMCDGSVRTLSPSISSATFQAMGTPNSGDIVAE